MTIEEAKVPEAGEAAAAITVDPHRRLDQLSPLIHELVAWELVHPDASGNWVLHDDVQQRLRELADLRPHSIAQVYVGRQCQQCGTVGVTRLIDGVRICAACSRAAKEPGVEPTHEKPPGRHRRWHRKAG